MLDRAIEYRASSAQDAIRIAEDFKTKGRYDWFRGQTCLWPLCPKLNRLDEEHRKTALLRLLQFAHWLKQIPALRIIDENDEAKLAVAQHYGIPTHFLDFTTEPKVAAFFATHETASRADKEGYILCLDTADLITYWKFAYPDLLPLKKIVLDVSDLWRLHAQSGVFLDCPYGNLEDAYAIDRIVFPKHVPSPTVPLQEIYPDRKSRLELLLEEFFDTERQQWALEEFQPMTTNVTMWPSPDKLESASGASGISLHQSWTEANLWQRLPGENFFTTRTTLQLQVPIDNSLDPLDAGVKATRTFTDVISKDPAVRKQLVTWIPLLQKEDPERSRKIKLLLSELWDGLRTYPYSNEDVAIALGTCISAYLIGSKINSSDKWERACRTLFGDVIEVAFGGLAGGSSRCFVSTRALLDAIRPDLIEHLSEDLKKRYKPGDLRQTLSFLFRPQRLFDFQKFARVFARQIVPIQVCQGYEPKIYSAAELKTFGLP